jgi:tetratricopeptide (TPR) repeat protein
MRRDRHHAVVVPLGVPEDARGLGLGVAAMIHGLVRLGGENIALAQLFAKPDDSGNAPRSIETYLPSENWQSLDLARQEPPVELVLTGTFEPPTEGRGTFQLVAYDPHHASASSRVEHFIDDDDDAGSAFVLAITELMAGLPPSGLAAIAPELTALADIKGMSWSVLESVIHAERCLLADPARHGMPNNLPAAFSFLGRAVSELPSNNYLLGRLASAAIDVATHPATPDNLLDTALRAVTDALDDAPDALGLQEAQAVLYQRKQMTDKAIEVLARMAKQTLPADQGARLTGFHCGLLRQAGRTAQAEDTLRAAKALYPEASVLHLEEGRSLLDAGNVEGAKAAWERVLARDEGHAFAAAMMLAELATKTKDASLAASVTDRLLAIAAQGQEVPVPILRTALRIVQEFEPSGLSKSARIAKLCEHLVTANPLDVGAMLIAAKASADPKSQTADGIAEALRLLHQISTIAPESVFAAEAARGKLHLTEPEALEAIEQAVKDAQEEMLSELPAIRERLRSLRTAHPLWLVEFGLGICEKRMQDTVAALASFERARKLAPGAVAVLIELTDLLLTQAAKRPAAAPDASAENTSPAEEALQHIEKACSEEPDTVECHAWRGKTLHALGRTADAVEALELGLRLAPDSQALHALLNEVKAPPPKPKVGLADSIRAFFTKK